MATLGLFQNIESNRRRSVMLVVGALVLLGTAGSLFGHAWGGVPWIGLAIALTLGAGLSALAWGSGDSIVLAAAGAQEVGKTDDPELVNVVEEMAIAAGLPRPRVYVMDSTSLNAFATGMSPEKSVVAVTRGLRDTLNRDELQGVVAHEMAHIGNLDTRLMVLMAVLVGSVVILSDMFLRGSFYGRRSRSKAHPAIMVVALLFALLAPIVATFIQFAVSRQREYLADATAASLTRNPGALADALEKLSGSAVRLEAANRGTQHLYIVNPLRMRQQLNHAFATHPPIADRIRRLRAIAGVRSR